MKSVIRALLLVVLLMSTLSVQAQDATQAQLDDFIADIAAADGPAVVARITIGDQSWAAAGGLVDTEGREAATVDGLFRIASMSKTWLAVVVMQLNDRGVLGLDDAAAKWLPDEITSQIANADQATIRELLTMTSGIPEYLNEDFYNAVVEDPNHDWTAAEALTFAYGLPASFAPSDGFEYCNSNYVLLQLIVEAATGKPMHEVMREQIFTPLGLTNTYVQAREQGAAFVHGYEDFDGDGADEDVTDVNDGAGLGDGALISNTEDLTRFYQALFVEHSLLGEEAVQAMIEAGKHEHEYGIGLEVRESDYGTLVGHTGAVLGYTGAVFYVEEFDAVVVILYGSSGLDEAHVEQLIEIAAGE